MPGRQLALWGYELALTAWLFNGSRHDVAVPIRPGQTRPTAVGAERPSSVIRHLRLDLYGSRYLAASRTSTNSSPTAASPDSRQLYELQVAQFRTDREDDCGGSACPLTVTDAGSGALRCGDRLAGSVAVRCVLVGRCSMCASARGPANQESGRHAQKAR
jgi:hypothetical protein